MTPGCTDTSMHPGVDSRVKRFFLSGVGQLKVVTSDGRSRPVLRTRRFMQ